MSGNKTLYTIVASALGLVLAGGTVIGLYEPQVEYAGYPPAALGVIVAVGTIVVLVMQPGVDEPTKHLDETVLHHARPTTVVPGFVAASGYGLGIVGVWALFQTSVPIAYPTLTVVGGIYLYTRGVVRVWRNSVTRYYLTDNSVATEYRLFSLSKNSVPYDKTAGCEVKQSFLQRIFGHGHCVVQKQSNFTLVANDIRKPKEFETKFKRFSSPSKGGPEAGRSEDVETDYELDDLEAIVMEYTSDGK